MGTLQTLLDMGLQTFLLILQVVVAVCLIGFILIQHGKGADAGAAFGSGASSTVFGSQGSSNFLTKSTAFLAFIFLSNSLFLAYLATQTVQRESLMEGVEMTVIEEPIEMTSEMTSESTTIDESDIPALPRE